MTSSTDICVCKCRAPKPRGTNRCATCNGGFLGILTAKLKHDVVGAYSPGEEPPTCDAGTQVTVLSWEFDGTYRVIADGIEFGVSEHNLEWPS